jgi:hypothetical protein
MDSAVRNHHPLRESKKCLLLSEVRRRLLKIMIEEVTTPDHSGDSPSARQTRRNEDSRAIMNDLSCNSHRVAIENAKWENEARTRGDGTGQLVIMGPRVRGGHYYIGEEGYPQCDVPIFTGQNPRARAQKETGERGIINYLQQEIYTIVGLPQSLHTLQGMEVGKAMRAQRRGFGAHTQELHNVEENEQRGGPSTAQSSANRIGPTGWSSTANHNKGTGLGESDLHAYHDGTPYSYRWINKACREWFRQVGAQ